MTPNLTKIAASLKANTKVAAKAALKAHGLKQTLADDVQRAFQTLELARQAKRATIYKTNTRRPTGRPPVRLPKGTLTQRLANARRATVSSQYARLYRQPAHGDISVTLTTDPTKVGVYQSEHQDWDGYARSCKYPMRMQTTHITAPTQRRDRVERHGLSVVDGMMTLDAAPIESVGCELFAATWVMQGRGTSVTAQRGYIARFEGVTYHAPTLDQALSGVSKKRRELALTVRLNAADLGELVALRPDARVSVDDARATGACIYGIRSWCAAVGLPAVYDEATDTLSGSATLAEVYAAYQREPRIEARATIIRALRRNRQVIGV